ncbi:MAG: ketoacyl-ACP synthase III [Tissierellia bacterium]|nr:ketoacyl-ACP synthase III [Tissierellia bacterium]
MKGIEILGYGYAKAEHRITNDDLEKIVDTSDEWIVARTGISSRYVSENKNTSDLAYEAAIKAIGNAGIDSSEISLIVVATITPDKFTPSTASIIQEKLNLNQPMMAFDINAACSGYVYALEIASKMIDIGETALVIGAETLSKILDYSDRNTCILFGDGAGASIIKKTGTDKSIEFHSRSVPDVNHVLFANGVSQSTPLTNDSKDYGYLEMNGKEVFRFAIKVMQESIESLLNQIDKSIDEIDLIIPHQANIRIISHVARKLKVDIEKFYTNLHEYGNTSAASIAMALACANEEGILREGMKIIIVGFGAGLTYGASYIEL